MRHRPLPVRSFRRLLVMVTALVTVTVVYYGLKPLLAYLFGLHREKQLSSQFYGFNLPERDGKRAGASVKGQQCVQPQLKLWHDELIKFFQDPKPLECNLVEENWIFVSNGTFIISEKALDTHGDIECQCMPLLRGDDDDDLVKQGNIISPMLNGTLITSDFFAVRCLAEDGSYYDNIHSAIAFSDKIHKRSHSLPKNSLKMNILMFGLDSTSRMTWMRNLPRTHDYVVDQLGAVVMEGYNIVGDGTPQALLPILTGRTEVELPEARRGYEGARPVDDHPWIWRNLQKHGYVTQWGEDGAAFGTFNYRMLGFEKQPVDHYMRPFYLMIEKLYYRNKRFCLGSVPRHLNMLNWIREFFYMYPSQPKFSFLFHSEYSHEGHSESRLADQDIKDLIWELNENGQLERTILILMADHGARFQSVRRTDQGKYEERLPYLAIRVPLSLNVKHPEILENLKVNSHRLTTPFDIHETFLDILNYSGPGFGKFGKLGNISSRGISLFKEIPKERTCSNADIAPHWCTCFQWVKAPLDDANVIEAAQELVITINSFTFDLRNKCQVLSLLTINSAVMFSANEKLLRFKESEDEHGRVPDLSGDAKTLEILYQITITTSPGEGQFEATLVFFTKERKFSISEKQISRVNKYGDQPACIMKEYPHLRAYCYCKQLS